MKGGLKIQDDLSITPAANLPDGWKWRMYDDGSGGLYSPENKCVVDVDFATSEYCHQGKWHFMDGYPYETISQSDFMDDMEKYVRGILKNEEKRLKTLSTESNETNRPAKKKESILAVIRKNRELINLKYSQQKGQVTKETDRPLKSNEAR